MAFRPLRVPNIETLKRGLPDKDPWDAVGQGLVSFGSRFNQGMEQARKEALLAQRDREQQEDHLARMDRSLANQKDILREQQRLKGKEKLSPAQIAIATGEITTDPGAPPVSTIARREADIRSQTSEQALASKAQAAKDAKINRTLGFVSAKLQGYADVDPQVIPFLTDDLKQIEGALRSEIDDIYSDPEITEAGVQEQIRAFLKKHDARTKMKKAGIAATKAYNDFRETGLAAEERLIGAKLDLKREAAKVKAKQETTEEGVKAMSQARNKQATSYKGFMDSAIKQSIKGVGALNVMGAPPLNKDYTEFLNVAPENARQFISTLQSWAQNPWWLTNADGTLQKMITQPGFVLDSAFQGMAKEDSPLQSKARQELKALLNAFNQTHAAYYGPVAKEQNSPEHPDFVSILNEKIMMAKMFFHQQVPYLEKVRKNSYNPNFYRKDKEGRPLYNGDVFTVGENKKRIVFGRQTMRRFIRPGGLPLTED